MNKSGSSSFSLLDYVALGLIALSIVVIAVIANSRFAHLMLTGSVLSALYGYKKDQRDLVIIASFTPAVCLLGWWGRYAVLLMTPTTMDERFLALDHGVGVGAWHWCVAHPFSYSILGPVYIGLAFAIPVGLCFSPRRQELA